MAMILTLAQGQREGVYARAAAKDRRASEEESRVLHDLEPPAPYIRQRVSRSRAGCVLRQDQRRHQNQQRSRYHTAGSTVFVPSPAPISQVLLDLESPTLASGAIDNPLTRSAGPQAVGG